ncbi:MAG: DUF6632 domain-containing protein [Spirochaetota bacterium]
MENAIAPQKLKRLLWLGRIVAVAFGAFFTIGILSNLTGHAVQPDSGLGQLVRWGHGGEPQEVMLGSIYLMIAVYLWKAVKKPAQHWLHIDFALYANVAHSVAMVVLSFVWPNSMQHLWGDSLLTIIPTLILGYAWFPVRPAVRAQ